MFEYSSNKLHIFAGGNRSNLFFNSPQNGKDGWVISGIGLKADEYESSIFTKNDWSNHLDNLNNINGHFILVKWNNEKITFESDPIGLRDIYISEGENEIVFSTRVDWLAKSHKLKINFDEFGSRWLLFNQISNSSVFFKTDRIVAGKKVSISLNENRRTNYSYNWLPDKQGQMIGVDDYLKKLKPLIFIEEKPSLGLSGGMDSRVLLSYLLKENIKFDTFTFGSISHPDSLMAHKIVKDFNLSHKQYNAELPSIDKLISKIKEYTTLTIVNNASSAIFQSLNYSLMNNQHSVLIDGCFGEIFRREFFYKLYFNGKKFLLNKDAKGIIPHILLHHADIFNEDINNLMIGGIEKKLLYWFENLPSVEEIGIENWLDLFALKTRMPNYFLHEQTIIDNVVTSIMPFAQLNLLKTLFNIPIPLRKNGKLLRQIIKQNYSFLEKYPLVKGNSTYPYYFNSFQSRLLSYVRKKTNKNIYRDNSRDKLLNLLKPYILDISSSQTFKNSEIYNPKKIIEIINNYYRGNLTYGYSLDWWLSFELFRLNIE